MAFLPLLILIRGTTTSVLSPQLLSAVLQVLVPVHATKTCAVTTNIYIVKYINMLICVYMEQSMHVKSSYIIGAIFAIADCYPCTIIRTISTL